MSKQPLFHRYMEPNTDPVLVEGIRVARNKYIDIVAWGNYGEKEIQRVVSVLQFGLDNGVYSDTALSEQEPS